MKYLRGFSLLELSVVVIVLALISVVTLRTTSMLDNAKLKKIYQEVQNQKSAFNNFKEIYQSFPGDMSNAYDVWGANCHSDSEYCNGNGDGYITIGGAANTDETFMSLRHMYLAELLRTPYSGLIGPIGESSNANPANVINSSFGNNIAYKPPHNADGTIATSGGFLNKAITVIGLRNTATLGEHILAIVTPKQAALFDNKFDDAEPWFGNIRTYTAVTGLCVTGATGVLAENYNVDNRIKVCNFVFLLEAS